MPALPIALCSADLPDHLVDFVTRFCPVLDRAVEEVAFHWHADLTMTRVYGRPSPGVVACFHLHTGLGPGGLQGNHDPRGGDVWADTTDQLAQRLSHEVFEWLVNPEGLATCGPYAMEVCDPVSVTPWWRPGPGPDFRDVPLSNFVRPAYFEWGPYESLGWPYDQLGIVTTPGHPEPGGYQTVNGVLVAGPTLGMQESP